MEFMTRGMWASLGWGIAMCLAVGIAVFGLGAPPWILLPALWGTLTAHTLLTRYVDQRTGRTHH